MKKIKKSILYIRLFRPVFHFLLIVISFFLIYKLRLRTDLIPLIQLEIPAMDFNETMIFALFSGMVFILYGFLNWIYELFKPIHWYYRKFSFAFFIGIITIAFIAYVGHGFLFHNWISRFVLFVWSLFSFVFITVFDVFYNIINSKFEAQVPYKILFLYNNKKSFEKIEKNFAFYKIYKICGKDLSELGEKIWLSLKDYDIIITIWTVERQLLQKIADYTRIAEKSFYHISESYFLEDIIYSPERVWPILALEYKASPLDGWFRVLKRIFDIILSLVFLIFFFWLYLLVIIFIYIKDGRPIFYSSQRVGKWGNLFKMYKFRTMVKNAENIKNELLWKSERKGPLFKLKNDPRIKPWWKFLRKASLDELPQVFNILKWDMSWVGPRPHLHEEVENYEWWQKRLLSAKPGLTGYAQVFGRDKLDFHEEAKLDLYYIQNRSVFLDIYVIITTLRVVFKWS